MPICEHLRRIPLRYTICWSVSLFVLVLMLFLIRVYATTKLAYYSFQAPPLAQVEASAALGEWKSAFPTQARRIAATRYRTVTLEGWEMGAEIWQFEDQTTGEREFDTRTLQTHLHYWALSLDLMLMLLTVEGIGLPVLWALRFAWRALAARKAAKQNRRGFSVLANKEQ